ncbi:unnamed protein product, partial [Rotaria socialis]
QNNSKIKGDDVFDVRKLTKSNTISNDMQPNSNDNDLDHSDNPLKEPIESITSFINTQPIPPEQIKNEKDNKMTNKKEIRATKSKVMSLPNQPLNPSETITEDNVYSLILQKQNIAFTELIQTFLPKSEHLQTKEIMDNIAQKLATIVKRLNVEEKIIQHMIAFIQQEAAEKVEEIEAKAEEEFNIEKKSKVQHSNLANASRLSILKARDDYVQALKEEARKQLVILTKYTTILANLIAQGLFLLMETDITLRCRRNDFSLVQQLIPDAIQRYKQELKQKDIKITIDDKNFIADDSFIFLVKNLIFYYFSAGGIELYAMGGKIKVSNTIEARLSMIFNQILLEIQAKLFGINQNRKYHD